MYDPISDSDVESDRPPRRVIDRANDPFANVTIIRRRIGNLSRHACDLPQKVRTTDDTDETFILHHGQPLDVVLLHESDDVLQTGVFLDSKRIPCHYLTHPAAVFANEIGAGAAGANEKL